MHHRIAALAAATVLLASGALATATSASATTDPSGSWDHIWTINNSGLAGEVWVKEYGDVIEICDMKADGLTPEVTVWALQSGTYYPKYSLAANGGSGSCVERGASDGGNYNLPENTEIQLSLGFSQTATVVPETYFNDH